MGVDKRFAGQKKDRLPEKLFFALALLGGSAGVWVGMKAFRHKTLHKSFYFGIPVIIAVQVILLLYYSLRAA